MVGGMVLLWLLIAILPATTAIAIQGVIQLVANCARAFFSRAWIDWRIVAFATLGLGVAVSLLALVQYTPTAPVISICVGLLPVLVWIPMRWLKLDASHALQAALCGFLSGGLNVGVGVAGPIVDIFFIRTRMDRRQIIATKAVLQVISHLAKIIYYSASLLALTHREITYVTLSAPFAVLGSMLGHFMLLRLTNEGFREGTRWLVTLVGVLYFVQGLYLLAAD
jgi:hypothetical protein